VRELPRDQSGVSWGMVSAVSRLVSSAADLERVHPPGDSGARSRYDLLDCLDWGVTEPC